MLRSGSQVDAAKRFLTAPRSKAEWMLEGHRLSVDGDCRVLGGERLLAATWLMLMLHEEAQTRTVESSQREATWILGLRGHVFQIESVCTAVGW